MSLLLKGKLAMRKTVIVLIALAACTLTQAQVPGVGSAVTGSVGVEYQSLYMWRGFNVFAGKSATQISGDLNLVGTGFGMSVLGHVANSGGTTAAGQSMVNSQRWDYNPYYQGALFTESTMMTQYRLGYLYFNYPESSSHVTGHSADLQELHAIFSLPKVTGVEGLVPTYVLVKLWPNSSNSLTGAGKTAPGATGGSSGFAHIFMLDYQFAIPGPISSIPEQIIKLHSELVFNDGVDPRPNGPGVDHDWSNMVLGASTDFDLGNNITLTPAVYHQLSFEDTVNENDEWWATLGAKYAF
jgi:hypothetical protein